MLGLCETEKVKVWWAVGGVRGRDRGGLQGQKGGGREVVLEEKNKTGINKRARGGQKKVEKEAKPVR